MPKWNLYIGLFSGILFIFLGILLIFLPSPAPAPWMKDFLPFVLGAYGLLRLGMSLYFLRRKPPVLLLLLAFVLVSCQLGPEDNMHVRFTYDGECSTCPIARMDSLLQEYFPKAIVETVYDSANNEVILKLDSNHVKADTLITVLLAYGYAVNDQLPYNPLMSPCCTPIGEDSPSTASLALVSPEDASPKEEMTLLEQELEQELNEEQLPSGDLEEIGSLEESLEDLEDLGLEEGPALEGLEEGLDEIGLDEELGLDEPSTPKKKTTSPGSTPK